ncbi:alpha/beta fold hydrolase [Streptomyces sp. NPDC021093]|uniref:alpha/beta fold hydrolase n=1 Tax=Streptomyces sp. NPDC021093 TaxID=3365112 RepID=UPI00379DA57E
MHTYGNDRPDPLTTDDGVRLWTARTVGGGPSSGPEVVLCHGGPGIWDTLEDVAALLHDAGASTVHRWDQRGCGRSERSGPYTVERHVADLDAVRAHFGLDRMVLLGHSWGARLALHYALRHPDRVAALVHVSGTGIDPDASWHPDYRRDLYAGIGEGLPRWRELTDQSTRTDAEEREVCVLRWSADFAGQDRERARALAERMATPWRGVNFESNRALGAELRDQDLAQLRAECEKLTVPTLIVDGALDIRPRTAVDSLARALPDVVRTVLPEAGHLPWAEDPAGFREAVSRFLLTSARAASVRP